MLFKYVFDVSQLSKDEINELYENLEQHSFMTGIKNALINVHCHYMPILNVKICLKIY